MTSYTYSIQNDTANHKVASDTLSREIQISWIVTALDHIDTVNDNLIIYFRGDLSDADHTILTSIVNNHKGAPTANIPLVLYKVSPNFVSGFVSPWTVAPPAGYQYNVVRTHLTVDTQVDLNSATANFAILNAGNGTISVTRGYTCLTDYITRCQQFFVMNGHNVYQWNYLPNPTIDSSIPLRSSVSGMIQLTFNSGIVWAGGNFAALTVEVLSTLEI